MMEDSGVRVDIVGEENNDGKLLLGSSPLRGGTERALRG